jgi:PAS domain S-box-containing protein
MITASPRRASAAPDHFVHFYDDDTALMPSVSQYLEGGLASGCAAVMIADTAHTAQVLELWRGRGVDYEAAQARGQLVILDAREALGRFMTAAGPDAALFDATVGQIVRSAIARHGNLVAFGEMVALLCADGRADAAVELENLWNQLAQVQPFSLYCAYGMDHFRDGAACDAFAAVCRAHSHVTPSENLHIPHAEHEQLALITQLHQKASALERELELRLHAEARLRDRERDLSDFIDNGAIGLHRVGPGGTIIWANRAELEMLGYTAVEFIGRNIADFYVDKDLICRILETLSSGGSLKDQAARLICKDGSIKHVLINSNAQVEDGQFIATRCFTRDVTDRWLAQEALRERGAVLHLALQGARMGYWIGDLERWTIRCSPEMASLLELSDPTEGPLQDFIASMHPEDRDGFEAALRASIEARSMFTAEFRARGGRPDWRWFEARGEAVYDEGARPVRFYGTCADVTARKREDHMIRHFACVVDSAKDVIISTQLDGIVTSWNAAARELFGYKVEDIVGKPIETVIPPELQAEERSARQRIARGEAIPRYVTKRVTREGSLRAMSLALSPVRDARGHVVGVSRISHEVAT